MSETMSLPAVILLGTIFFFAVRYVFFSRPFTAGSPASARDGPAARRVDVSKVNQVSQMFPQLDRRAIAWDLSRNGGNVGATTERVLEGRNLDEPPPSFRPLNLTPPTATTSSSTASTTAVPAPKSQDLIARYNLASKLRTEEEEDEAGEPDEEEARRAREKEKSWAASKSERAALLAKRREEMILNARRKMEAQQRREAKGKGKEVI